MEMEGLQGFAITYDAVMNLINPRAIFFYLTHIPEYRWPHTFHIWLSELSYSSVIVWVKIDKLVSVF